MLGISFAPDQSAEQAWGLPQYARLAQNFANYSKSLVLMLLVGAQALPGFKRNLLADTNRVTGNLEDRGKRHHGAGHKAGRTCVQSRCDLGGKPPSLLSLTSLPHLLHKFQQTKGACRDSRHQARQVWQADLWGHYHQHQWPADQVRQAPWASQHHMPVAPTFIA